MYKTNNLKVVVLTFSTVLFSTACKKGSVETVPQLKEEPLIWVVGSFDDSFETEIYDPPIVLDADFSQSISYDLDQDEFPDMVIRGFHSITRSAEVSYQASQKYISIACECQIAQTIKRDSIYYRPLPAMDTVVKFNLQSGMYRELLDNREGYTWETGHTISYPSLFLKGENIFYQDDSLNWKRQGSLPDDKSNFLFFHEERFSIDGYIEVSSDSTNLKQVPIRIYKIYNLWRDRGRGFLIFRKQINNKFKYGWLEIRVSDSDKAFIYSKGISKKYYDIK